MNTRTIVIGLTLTVAVGCSGGTGPASEVEPPRPPDIEVSRAEPVQTGSKLAVNPAPLDYSNGFQEGYAKGYESAWLNTIEAAVQFVQGNRSARAELLRPADANRESLAARTDLPPHTLGVRHGYQRGYAVGNLEAVERINEVFHQTGIRQTIQELASSEVVVQANPLPKPVPVSPETIKTQMLLERAREAAEWRERALKAWERQQELNRQAEAYQRELDRQTLENAAATMSPPREIWVNVCPAGQKLVAGSCVPEDSVGAGGVAECFASGRRMWMGLCVP